MIQDNNSSNSCSEASRSQSRREFLRTVAAAAASCVVCGVVEVSSGASRKVKRSTGYLLVDPKKCQGCASCMLACSTVHEGEPSMSLSRIQIVQNTFASYPDDISVSQCRQCVDPLCMKECPTKAIKVSRSTGYVRYIDTKRCIGCGTCTEACPYTPARSAVAPDKKYKGKMKARKCDLCSNAKYYWDKRKGGVKGKQACVEVCPTNAIRFSRKTPSQSGNDGYIVHLRDQKWSKMGFAID